ncbi:fibropellin-1-like [Lineus longissimus]|uniref:fibropellin-1-like n=1 Tax=Lineus longissimus TaxID=88925 RepID=UPI00315C56D8
MKVFKQCLLRFCNTELPADSYTFDKVLEFQVVFSSDTYTHKKGFWISYQIIEIVPTTFPATTTAVSGQTGSGSCGGIRTVQTTGIDYLMSPNYPGQYDNNIYCAWNIQVKENNARVVLKFEDFDVDTRGACTANDFVKVRRGGSTAPGDILTFCNAMLSRPNGLITSGSYKSLVVEFSTNDYTNARGFKASYKIDCVNCDRQINECSSNPCQHGGLCKDGVNGFQCTCTSGYFGDNCEKDVNECLSSPCDNGGTCINLAGGYRCQCPAGYHGDRCGTDTDECISSPCKNGARCVNGINKYTCYCPSGFAGVHCETNINDCQSNPCKYGRCIDLVDSYTCICNAGYSGKNCRTNIDDCKGNPCKQGALCQDLVNDFACSCPPGYDGKTCNRDVNECASSPCAHGSCTDAVNGFTCACDLGYTDTLCDRDINECASSPCQGAATCVDLAIADGTAKQT